MIESKPDHGFVMMPIKAARFVAIVSMAAILGNVFVFCQAYSLGLIMFQWGIDPGVAIIFLLQIPMAVWLPRFPTPIALSEPIPMWFRCGVNCCFIIIPILALSVSCALTWQFFFLDI